MGTVSRLTTSATERRENTRQKGTVVNLSANYLDPQHCPIERPTRARMTAATRELHDALDANRPWLHPERRTIQRDLGSSANGIAWQEAKKGFVQRGDGAWSALPHLYARYGTEGTTELIAKLR